MAGDQTPSVDRSRKNSGEIQQLSNVLRSALDVKV